MRRRLTQEEQADREQRRLDYEAACVAENEYYKRKESGSLTKNPVELKKRKTSFLSRPSHQRYLRENNWIKRMKGMKEYFIIH